MSEHKFIASFRNGIKFSDRLIKNTKIQLKYLYKKGKKIYAVIQRWYRTKYGNWSNVQATSFSILIILLLIFILPILLVWAFLKSI